MMLLGSLGIALLAAKTNGQVVVGTILAFFGTAFGVAFFPTIAPFVGVVFLFLGGYAVYRLSK
jgi:predicted benzoate:H+ symporter BenE